LVATFADGKIETYVGPTELGAADDLEAVIVEFIARAKKSLDIAVQELDSEPIAQAILDARWRGVDVDLFLEQDYLRSELKGTPPESPKPKPGETPEQALFRTQWLEDETELKENRRILTALLRSDVQVRGDYNPAIFHQKFILRDYRGGKALPSSAPPVWLGQVHAHGHAPEPEPRLRLPQRLRLPPVRDRGRAAPPRQLRARPAR
jgi:phosphatidylserine/phosphatidylglycerophosphate/cardiolipin synthase-like enzyme